MYWLAKIIGHVKLLYDTECGTKVFMWAYRVCRQMLLYLPLELRMCWSYWAPSGHQLVMMYTLPPDLAAV
jgi:hypothetical protein